MERTNTEMVSLTDALRDGASPEDIRKSFEAALQDAQNEVAAEQAKTEASKLCYGGNCSGNCSHCADAEECELDETRENMVYAVLDYLVALGLIPEDLEVEDGDIEQLIESIKEVEKEFQAKISFMKMLGAIAKAKAADEEKAAGKETEKVSAADAIIKDFLKGLR